MATRRTDRTHTLGTLALLAGALLLLAGCGSDGFLVASGGIGGTGKGTISGYGSIIINGDSEFTIDADTDLRVDGVTGTQGELEAMGTGFVAEFVLADDADPLLLGGTALSVHVEHQLVGPVTTAGALLEVLGQRVLVNANTQLAGVADRTELESRPAGSILRVSGYPSGDNLLLATRVEALADPADAPTWKLIGHVTDLDATVTLNIGSQQVSIVGVTPTDCGAGLVTGDFVDVRAAANDPFTPGDPLGGVTSVTCTNGGLSVPPGIGTLTTPAMVEGLAEGVTPGDDFLKVDGQLVLLTDGTQFQGGEREDLVDGARVQVRGTLDVASGILTAGRVRFLMTAVRIVAPLDRAAGYVAGASITLLGIPATITPLTRGEGSVVGPICDVLCQVRLVGFKSGATVYALRVTAQGPANPDRVELRGPVSAFDEGLSTLTILGVVVDVTGTGRFYGAAGGQVEQAQFFADLGAVVAPDNPQVTAKTGVYGGGSTITDPASVRIED